MKAVSDISISKQGDKISEQFRSLLVKANKEHPRPADVKALSDLLYKNKGMELWKEVIGMGALAEHAALEGIAESVRDYGSVGNSGYSH